MIRRNQAFLNHLNVLIDWMIVIAAYVLSSWIWINLLEGDSRNLAALSGHTLLLSALYALVVFILLSMMDFYSTTRTRRLSWKLRTIFLAVTVAVLLASTVLFFLRMVDFSRGVLYMFYGITLVFLFGKYTLMRAVFNGLRSKGYNRKHVVIVGTGRLAMQLTEDLEKERELGFQIIGYVGSQAAENAQPYLGSFKDLDHLLALMDAQEVILALDPTEYIRIRELIAACEKNGVKYYVIPFYNDMIPLIFTNNGIISYIMSSCIYIITCFYFSYLYLICIKNIS